MAAEEDGTKSLTQADRTSGLAARRGSHQTNSVRSHGGRLSATQEQTIEVGHRNGRPGWATVIALICALGRFHLAQQCIHLVDRQQSICAHLMVASHRGKKIVARIFVPVAVTGLSKIGQDIAQQRFDVGIP